MSQALVITDGGLPALVAAAIEAERFAAAENAESGGGAPALLMPWVTNPALTEVQLTAVASQARFLRQELLEPAPIREFATGTSPAFLDSLGLLVAVEVARANGCGRIVWPVHTHATDDTLAGGIDGIAASVDRALLVERLAMLDAEPASVTPDTEDLAIETPLVDVTDAQVAELVVDLDAPAYLCWWWRPLTEDAAERTAASERTAWTGALHDAGWVSASPGVHIHAPTSAASAQQVPNELLAARPGKASGQP